MEEFNVEQWRTSKCSSGGTPGLLRVLALERSSALERECECLRVGSRARSQTQTRKWDDASGLYRMIINLLDTYIHALKERMYIIFIIHCFSVHS